MVRREIFARRISPRHTWVISDQKTAAEFQKPSIVKILVPTRWSTRFFVVARETLDIHQLSVEVGDLLLPFLYSMLQKYLCTCYKMCATKSPKVLQVEKRTVVCCHMQHQSFKKKLEMKELLLFCVTDVNCSTFGVLWTATLHFHTLELSFKFGVFPFSPNKVKHPSGIIHHISLKVHPARGWGVDTPQHQSLRRRSRVWISIHIYIFPFILFAVK